MAPVLASSSRTHCCLACALRRLCGHWGATYPPSYLPTYLPACLPACLPASLPACLPAYLCVHAYIHACMLAYIHAYIHPSMSQLSGLRRDHDLGQLPSSIRKLPNEVLHNAAASCLGSGDWDLVCSFSVLARRVSSNAALDAQTRPSPCVFGGPLDGLLRRLRGRLPALALPIEGHSSESPHGQRSALEPGYKLHSLWSCVVS